MRGQTGWQLSQQIAHVFSIDRQGQSQTTPIFQSHNPFVAMQLDRQHITRRGLLKRLNLMLDHGKLLVIETGRGTGQISHACISKSESPNFKIAIRNFVIFLKTLLNLTANNLQKPTNLK
ncbi:MAG: hypothetical protein AAB176_03005 [Pseudomonadota bacterium]